MDDTVTEETKAMNETISLSLVEIDARIAEERRKAKEHSDAAEKLESLKKLAIRLGTPTSRGTTPKVNPIPPAAGSTSVTDYAGMGTKMAAINFLRQRGRPARTVEIARALLEGGKSTTSKKFYRTVFNTLTEAAKTKKTEIAKNGNVWVLKEWNLPPQNTPGY
jgi:hypothetical protein